MDHQSDEIPGEFEKIELLTYQPTTQTWATSFMTAKIHPEPFAKGAMRAAHLMHQKSETDGQIIKWVAKKYFVGPSDESVYQNDVVVQEISRHYAEMYNEGSPPKEVHIVPAFMIRCVERPEKDLYCIESYIPGEYYKHNTNSGALLRESGQWRNTPQCFSHFTYEKSNHELIIVDIQGVGDMYTDPQIHTNERNVIEKYGTGNLGIKGMALFLYTHQCNPLCEHFGLTSFWLYDDTVVLQTPPLWRASTVANIARKDRLSSVVRASSAAIKEKNEYISQKSLKKKKKTEEMQQSSSPTVQSSSPAMQSYSPTVQSSSPVVEATLGLRHNPKIARMAAAEPLQVLPITYYKGEIPMVPSTRCLVNLELGKFHMVGRLSQIDKINYEEAVKTGEEPAEEFDATPDAQAAFYHLQKAAQGGCIEAFLALARIHSPTQLLLPHQPQLEDPALVFKYLSLASERHCKEATYWTAVKAEKAKDNILAASCYQRLIEDTEQWYTVHPDELYQWDHKTPGYELKAALAKLLGDGEGVAQDIDKATELYTEAAEEATTAKKGKLAMQYYEAIEYLG